MTAQNDPTISIIPTASSSDPTGLCDLMIRLAGLRASDAVHVAWDSHGQLAQRAATISKAVSAEVPVAANGNTPHKFDVTLRFEPFARSCERPTAISAADSLQHIQHLLAHSTRRAVVAVTLGELSATSKTARTFRESVLAQRQIAAVIEMPGGLLPDTMLPFAILVFDLAGGHESVRMVDASRADCFEHGSRGRRQLVGVDELLDEVLAATPSACSTTVTVKTLLANDASLQVKRYFLSAREKGIKRYFDNAPAARLGDLVEIVSPIRGNAGMGETVTLHEVGVGDLPATGFIQHTSRVVPLDAAVAARKRTQFLRPGDLLLAVRRSGIDIGVTPPIIPASDAIGWIAGRAFTVLRALSGVPLDMRALAMFLRSPLGEELLRQLFAGCEVLQPKRLLELTFPTFNRDSERSAITAWDAEVTIQHDVDECLRRQSAIRRGLWPLDD